MGLEFEWDRDKAAKNLKKHGVSFEEASTVFADSLSSTIHDPLHSDEEDRYVTLGESNRRRLLVVAFTDREIEFASLAHGSPPAKERKEYEEGSKN